MTAAFLFALGLLLLLPTTPAALLTVAGLSVGAQWRAEKPAGYRIFGGQR